MGRSVILQSTPRCERCRFTPRWCICAGLEESECPVQIDVLFHHREFWRPTSTGRLINRVFPASRAHVFRPNHPLSRSAFVAPGRTLWILHPRGEPVEALAVPGALQVLLLDGSWSEAAAMSKTVGSWGQLVRLPATQPSRNALRRAPSAAQYSTAESLLVLLDALGLGDAAEKLRAQFELHVYAGLRTRGAKIQAAEFLERSALRRNFPELLRSLEQRRPFSQG